MLDVRDRFDDVDFDISFIEPNPERLLNSVDVENEKGVNLIQSNLQDIDLDFFSSLGEKDLLFIDSSHVVKYGSDLHYLFFEILPLLNKGVTVHFHDIFYPFEYPDEWLEKGVYWNECYFLHAFLAGNPEWHVVLFNHQVNLEFGDFIEEKMPVCRKNFGGSIYVQKL